MDLALSRVAVIWLALLVLAVLAVIALVVLGLPRGVRSPRQIRAWRAESAGVRRAGLEQQAAEAQEVVRYADEIAVAAGGAATTAERRRDECQRAQAAVEVAWQAWQDADAALERARQATAYTVADDPVDDEDREQALRRAAQAAYRRGDLSDEQLLDALTHRHGWDPTLHPVEQELVLARAAVEHRFAVYQKALSVEEDAWRTADVATASVRTLRTEVIAAQTRADEARQALPEPARAILDEAGPDPLVVATQRIVIDTSTTKAPLESLLSRG